MNRYDVLIIGGGIAGLQAAIQLGRYEHEVLVIDKGYGRSTLCKQYNNLLGWPQGVSGKELRDRGRQHAEQYGIEFVIDEITSVTKTETGEFVATGKGGVPYLGHLLLLSTGITDRLPPLEGLQPCMGSSIYICPDCDGYEAKGQRTLVLGSGNAGAHMALTLSYWTQDIVYINHEQKEVSAELDGQLREKNIEVIAQPARLIEQHEGKLAAIQLADGRRLEARIAFTSFGGNQIHTDLAKQLGVERLENGHAAADPRSKMSNVPGVWIAGDIGVHSEQLTVAMAEGSLSAIWMHKRLLQEQPELQLTH